MFLDPSPCARLTDHSSASAIKARCPVMLFCAAAPKGGPKRSAVKACCVKAVQKRSGGLRVQNQVPEAAGEEPGYLDA